jgi:hypothetical protein
MLEIQLRRSLEPCLYNFEIHRLVLRTSCLTSPDALYRGTAYVEAGQPTLVGSDYDEFPRPFAHPRLGIQENLYMSIAYFIVRESSFRRLRESINSHEREIAKSVRRRDVAMSDTAHGTQPHTREWRRIFLIEMLR